MSTRAAKADDLKPGDLFAHEYMRAPERVWKFRRTHSQTFGPMVKVTIADGRIIHMGRGMAVLVHEEAAA